MEFHDINSPETPGRFANELRVAEDRRLFLPIVVLDGEVVAIEWFSAWGLVDLVEERLAASAKAGAAVSG